MFAVTNDLVAIEKALQERVSAADRVALVPKLEGSIKKEPEVPAATEGSLRVQNYYARARASWFPSAPRGVEFRISRRSFKLEDG